MTDNKKKSPNHYVITSPKDGRVLYEYSSNSKGTFEIKGGSGKILFKSNNEEKTSEA